MTLNSQNKSFSSFLQFSATEHLSRVKCAEVALDRPGQRACEIFSIESTFFNHLSFGLLGSRSFSYWDLIFGYSFKTHYYLIARCTLIAQVAGPMLARMLSRVTWAFLNLLVILHVNGS